MPRERATPSEIWRRTRVEGEEDDWSDEFSEERESDWPLNDVALRLGVFADMLEERMRSVLDERKEEAQIKEALEKSDTESAKIHAANIIIARFRLPLPVRLRRVASAAENLDYNLENAKQIISDLLTAVVYYDLQEVLIVVEKLEGQLESLLVPSSSMVDTSESTISETSTLREQVDVLIRGVAIEVMDQARL